MPSTPLSGRAVRSPAPPISYLMAQGVENPGLISLAAGFVDQESLPTDIVRQAMEHVLTDPVRGKAALQYGSTEGDRRLRELIAARLRRLDDEAGASVTLSADRILIGTGSQQFLYLVADVLLDPGDIVLMGVPAYFVFMGVLHSVGATMAPVDTDEDGLIPESLEAVLKSLDHSGRLQRVKLLYDVTYFNNPTGWTLSRERRAEIAKLVQQWRLRQPFVVLEDAAYRELCYQRDAPASLLTHDPEGEFVLYAGSFSKTFAPGLKTGFVVVPPSMRLAITFQKGHHDFGSANLNQWVLAEALASGGYDEHLAMLRHIYRRKLSTTLEALEESFRQLADQVRWTQPAGGLYVWARFPECTTTSMESPLFRRCVDKGVLYVPGRFCFPDDGPRPDHFARLSFGVASEDAIRKGIHRLAEATKETLAERF